MTKTFKTYLIIWTTFFTIFNILTFASPTRINIIKGSFWVGYIFIIFAFLGQLYCSYIALKEQNYKKMFYNMSLILTSYIAIFCIMIVGTVCMVIPIFPIWLSIMACVMVTGLFALAIVTTCFAVDVVSDIDNEIQTKTYTIKKIATDAEHLISIANNEELKNICKKVYETLRYSDPMNNIALSEISKQIQNEFRTFELSINDNDVEMARMVSNELLNLIDKRNKECALLK